MKKDQIILYGFRYCHFQTGDIVQDMINYLTKNWLKISHEFRELIKKDIRGADRREKMHSGRNFGIPFDCISWRFFLRNVENIEERQAAHG